MNTIVRVSELLEIVEAVAELEGVATENGTECPFCGEIDERYGNPKHDEDCIVSKAVKLITNQIKEK